jgi:hypothetical protein
VEDGKRCIAGLKFSLLLTLDLPASVTDVGTADTVTVANCSASRSAFYASICKLPGPIWLHFSEPNQNCRSVHRRLQYANMI